jgi:hypothetical protein
MWWGLGSRQQPHDYDFMAADDKAQYVFVCPARKLVIVRNGIIEGLPQSQWSAIFYELARRFPAGAST